MHSDAKFLINISIFLKVLNTHLNYTGVEILNQKLKKAPILAVQNKTLKDLFLL